MISLESTCSVWVTQQAVSRMGEASMIMGRVLASLHVGFTSDVQLTY